MEDRGYIIVGDSIKEPQHKECLVYVCGTKERAEAVLDQLLNNPDETDLYNRERYTNFKIDWVPEKDCWWNQPGLD